MDSKEIFASNAARYDRYEDMAQMGELNEACVLDNLKQRYQSNLIYVSNNSDRHKFIEFFDFRASRDCSWLQSIRTITFQFTRKKLSVGIEAKNVKTVHHTFSLLLTALTRL